MEEAEVRFSGLEGVTALTSDLREAAKTLGAHEARHLVDLYYQIQDFRIEGANMGRAQRDSAVVVEGQTVKEPGKFQAFVTDNFERLENSIRRALHYYTQGSDLGIAVREVVGIGPVIAAGLLAHIDIAKAPTVGHIWRFAGLDPTSKWEKGEKRPWNARLKVLCYKAGESFVKCSNREGCEYGQVYQERKAQEWRHNIAGEFSEQATAVLAARKIGKDTEAHGWYSGKLMPADLEGWETLTPEQKTARVKKAKAREESFTGGVPMLPPAHIHARARRYAVKLFLSDFHYAAFKLVLHQEPPLPYVLTLPGHAHVWHAAWVRGL
jgi:hypothetical protein